MTNRRGFSRSSGSSSCSAPSATCGEHRAARDGTAPQGGGKGAGAARGESGSQGKVAAGGAGPRALTGFSSLSRKILRAVLLARTRLLLSAGGWEERGAGAVRSPSYRASGRRKGRREKGRALTVFSLSLSAKFFRGDSRGCSWRAASGTRVDSMAAAREESKQKLAARFFISSSNLAPEHSAANHNARRARGRPPPNAYWLECRPGPRLPF